MGEVSEKLLTDNMPTVQELNDLLINSDNLEFRLAVERLPKNYWAKYDLSAMRIGFEIANALNKQKLAQVERERDSTQALLEEAEGLLEAFAMYNQGDCACEKCEAGRFLDKLSEDYPPRLLQQGEQPLKS